MQEWNFDVQRQLPGNFLIDAAYAGSKGTKLPVNLQINQLPDQYLSMGSALLSQVPNPFAPFVKVGTLSQPTVARGQLLRPFPQFGSVTADAVHLGSSIYHAFQLKMERRFSKGFSILAAYTNSKLITDATSRLALNFANPGYQDYNNRRAERSLANIDIPQRLVVSYSWELPFGPGKPLLSNTGTVLDKIIGGWQLNGVTTVQKGLPLGLTTAGNTTNSFDGGSRPPARLNAFKLYAGSEWSRMNRYASQRPTRVGSELFGLLSECLEYSRRSEGAFDITTGPLMKAWGFYKGTGRLPTSSEVTTVLKVVGYRHFHLDRASRTVEFDRPGVELDPGGIGKGYAVDRMAAVLKQFGIEIALVTASSSTI